MTGVTCRRNERRSPPPTSTRFGESSQRIEEWRSDLNTFMLLRTAIIGCGLIGNKRAKALGDCPLLAAVDRDLARAQQLARAYPGCEASTDWRAAVARKDIDLVIVATTNDMLA